VPRAPAAGLKVSWEEALGSFERLLSSVLARLCPREPASKLSDIRQDARLRLWRALQGEREIRNTTSYMYRVAVSATLDALRSAKGLREEVLDGDGAAGSGEPQASPEELADRRERTGQVLRALAALPERKRRCVGLHLQGMTTTEIAELLGWSEAKARNLLYRGLHELRERLGEGEGDDESL
jgi:RNA polymerase sigma-70 factor (ECF subfamily)